jgi:hypothetical protein
MACGAILNDEYTGDRCVSAAGRRTHTHAWPQDTGVDAGGIAGAGRARQLVGRGRPLQGRHHPAKVGAHLPLWAVPRASATRGVTSAHEGTPHAPDWGHEAVSIHPLPFPVCSLIYPGYCFYYDNRGLTWGGFYSGDGLRNCDLVFML